MIDGIYLAKIWQRHQAIVTLALILMGALAVRVALLARGLPVVDSDEATFGLMARHLRGGEFSVFMWGQAYMGSIEAVLSLLPLWLFGATGFALRLAPLAMSLGLIATIYALGRRYWSPRVGAASALLIAVGAPFFVVLGLREFGGYIETALLGSVILLLALGGDRRPRIAAWLGLLAGVGVWTNPLILPFLIAAALVLWLQRRDDLRGRSGWLLAALLVLGALPALVANVASGGATLTTLAGFVLPGKHVATGSSLPLPARLVHNAWAEATVSLPILVGWGTGGTQSAGWASADALTSATQHPLAYTIDLVLGLVALACLVSAIRDIWRQRHTLRPLIGTLASTKVRRLQAELALLVANIPYLLALLLLSQDLFAIPRYLFPLITLVPVVVGRLERGLRWARVWAARRGVTVASGALPRLVWVACAGVVAWNLLGCATLTPVATAALDHRHYWIAGDDTALIRVLAGAHIHTLISNDYWVGLRLTFASDERIIAVMRFPDGRLGFNRYGPYVTRGLGDPQPAYLELVGTDEAAALVQRAASLPTYHLLQWGQYILLLPNR